MESETDPASNKCLNVKRLGNEGEEMTIDNFDTVQEIVRTGSGARGRVKRTPQFSLWYICVRVLYPSLYCGSSIRLRSF